MKPTSSNAKRVLRALQQFFNADTGYRIEDLTEPSTIIQLGVAPVRIDLMTQISRIPQFDHAWRKRVAANFGGVKALFIGLDDLITA